MSKQEIETLDFNDDTNSNKDNFMKGIYISLVILFIVGLIIYFFGYDILKPFIKV